MKEEIKSTFVTVGIFILVLVGAGIINLAPSYIIYDILDGKYEFKNVFTTVYPLPLFCISYFIGRQHKKKGKKK